MPIFELAGLPGPDGPKSVLRFRLEEDALDQLLNHADQDCRLYELWSLRQPGEMCHYANVKLMSPSTDLSDWLMQWLSENDREIIRRLHCGEPVSFSKFDDLFRNPGEDVNPAYWQWMAWRNGAQCRTYLRELLMRANTKLSSIRLTSSLAEQVLRRIETSKHEFCFLPEEKAIRQSSLCRPAPGRLSDSFLRALAVQLSEPNINSVAISADSMDLSLAKIVCTEQRRRTEQSGLPPGEAFQIVLWVDQGSLSIPNEWEAVVLTMIEGVPRADMWIDLGVRGRPFGFWQSRLPCLVALCAIDCGEREGYVRDAGDDWTLYRSAELKQQRANFKAESNKKNLEYKNLVVERKSCKKCPSLKNPSSNSFSRFDSDQIGPWTRWQGDLDAKLLIVGQDWGGSLTFIRQEGKDIESPTNATLRELLKSIGIEISSPGNDSTPRKSGVFLTNSVLCIKQGADNGQISAGYFSNCGSSFLLPQIELVSPKVVVTLGLEAYKATINAYGLTPRQRMREAVAQEERIQIKNGPEIVPVFHCGGLGLRNRSKPDQLNDWKRVHRAFVE